MDWDWAGHRRRCVCRRQHCRCHRVVASSSWRVGLRVCSIQRGVKWGWAWHGVNGVVVAQVGLWGGLGEGGLGLDRVATWVRHAINSVIVVAQVGLWGVVEEGETGLGRAGPPARLSSLPSCGGISVIVFVGVGWCCRHTVTPKTLSILTSTVVRTAHHETPWESRLTLAELNVEDTLGYRIAPWVM